MAAKPHAARRFLTTGWLVLGAFVGLTGFYLLGASRMVLTEPDEARCALIARHMVQTGDWLAPHLLDKPYFNKPPLYFWILASSVRLFGQNEWALRLPSALITATTVLLTGLLAAQLFGRRAGWLAGATFAVSVAATMAGRVVRMDMLLALLVTAALLCWSRAYLLAQSRRVPNADTGISPASSPSVTPPSVAMAVSPCLLVTPSPCHLVILPSPSPCLLSPAVAPCHLVNLSPCHAVAVSPRPRVSASPRRLLPFHLVTLSSCHLVTPLPWYVAMYACMGLGCLTKGPVAVLLPGLIIGIHLLLARLLRDLRTMHLPLGALIVAILFGSWTAYMAWRFPDYIHEFFFRQNLDRYAGSGLDASEPLLGRLTVFGSYLGAVLPWAALIGLASWHHRPRRSIPAAEMFLWVWGLTVLGFFSLSKGQLPNYILPALPSTFALLGGYLARAEEHRRPVAIGIALTFVLAAMAMIAWAIAEHLRYGQGDILMAGLRIVNLSILIVPTCWLWRRRSPAAALIPFLLGCAIFTTEVAYGPAPKYFESRSAAALVEPLKTLPPIDAPVIITTEPRYSVVYYAPPGWRFRVLDECHLPEAQALLATDQTVYAVLTGRGILRCLRQDDALKGRLTILARHDSDTFVRIAPPARAVAGSAASQPAPSVSRSPARPDTSL